MYKGIIFCSSTLWMMFNGSSNSTDDIHCTDELARLILCPLIAGVALLGNVLAVLSIRVRDKFRIPTYAAISCLAVSDSLAVIFRLARALTCRICVLYYDTRTCLSGKHTLYDKFGAIASIPSFISIHSSFCHLVLFSVIRYIIVVHPMFAHRYLTSGKVLRYSGLAWIVTFVISSAYVYCCVQFYLENEWFIKRFGYIDLVSVFYLFLITLPPLLVLHVAKKKSIPSTLTEQVKKMNLMTVSISVITVVSLLPTIILATLLFPDVDPITEDQVETFMTVAQLTFFLGHMMHPVLYFWIHVVQKKRQNLRHHQTTHSDIHRESAIPMCGSSQYKTSLVVR